MRQEASNVLSIELAVALAAQDKKMEAVFLQYGFLALCRPSLLFLNGTSTSGRHFGMSGASQIFHAVLWQGPCTLQSSKLPEWSYPHAQNSEASLSTGTGFFQCHLFTEISLRSISTESPPLRPDATTSLRGIKRTSRWTFKARSLSSSAISCSKTNVQLGNVQLDIIRSTYAAHQFCVTGDVSKLWAVSWGEWNSWKRLCLSSRSGRNNWSESKHSYEAVTSEGLRLQVPDMRRILKMFFRILQIYNVAQVQRCPDMSKPSKGMISTLCSPTWLYVLDPEKRHHVASVVWQQFVGSHLNSEKQTSGSCWSNMAFVRSDCTTLFDLGYPNLAPFMGIPLDQPV